jgi:3D (Asp-Asp-Asp) domain-containing protein
VRAHFTRPVTDEQGDLLPNVQVTVFDPGTTTPISQVLYTSDTGNTVLTNPFVSSTGVIDIYLDQPARVRFGIVQSNLPMQFYEDVDVLAAGSDSQHFGAGANSLMIGVGATSNGDASTALGPSASSAGVNSSAFGPNTNAVGDYSAALGQAATTQGASALAAGRTATATGVASTAVGNASQATADSATALGDGAVAGFTHSTAIGAGAEADGNNRIVMGTAADMTVIPQGSGIVMFDSNGVQWEITINTDGSLNTAQL